MNKYQISIRGKNPDYFLKKLIKENINIYTLEKAPNELIITVNKEGLKKIKKIKTSYKIKIIKIKGIEGLKEKIINNKYFISSFIISLLLIILLSNMIFKIEIVHSNKNIRDLVLNDLNDLGIKKFHFKVNYNQKELIKNKILEKNKDYLEWMEIEESGTKYIIKVEERKKNKVNKNYYNRNIVAKKNSTILEIIADKGEIVKKKYDYVLKNETIISGQIHNKDKIVDTICADGKVYGEVWYKVNVELPKTYHEEKLTGNKVKQVDINFINKNISLFNHYKTYKKSNIFSLKHKILPIEIKLSEYFETKEKNKTYNISNCDKAALEISTKKILEKLGSDDKIITKKVLKKEEKNSKIIVDVFFKVKEDITAYQKIENIEQKEGE